MKKRQLNLLLVLYLWFLIITPVLECINLYFLPKINVLGFFFSMFITCTVAFGAFKILKIKKNGIYIIAVSYVINLIISFFVFGVLNYHYHGEQIIPKPFMWAGGVIYAIMPFLLMLTKKGGKNAYQVLEEERTKESKAIEVPSNDNIERP